MTNTENPFSGAAKAEVLRALASEQDIDIRAYVAEHPNTPPEVLSVLTLDLNPAVQEAALKALWERHCARESSEAAKISDIMARRRVSFHPDTPAGVLRTLADDQDIDVRVNVAVHPNTPPNVLPQLASDPNLAVRRTVAINDLTPPALLQLLANDPEEEVRWCVAGNPTTPPEVLQQLASDPDKHVRRNVAENPNTPPDVLAVLTLDLHPAVQKAALKALQERQADQ
ncbi:hypothetical protein AGMMS50243_04240 [Betaproteobacteria bacterium]|nr:hypothetical protein AGMMS50243_04240 [Betaproteobacteria bacterium]